MSPNFTKYRICYKTNKIIFFSPDYNKGIMQVDEFVVENEKKKDEEPFLKIETACETLFYYIAPETKGKMEQFPSLPILVPNPRVKPYEPDVKSCPDKNKIKKHHILFNIVVEKKNAVKRSIEKLADENGGKFIEFKSFIPEAFSHFSSKNNIIGCFLLTIESDIPHLNSPKNFTSFIEKINSMNVNSNVPIIYERKTFDFSKCRCCIKVKIVDLPIEEFLANIMFILPDVKYFFLNDDDYIYVFFLGDITEEDKEMLRRFKKLGITVTE